MKMAADRRTKRLKCSCTSSTVSLGSRAFSAIDAKRRKAGLSVDALCQAAGINSRNWYLWAAGRDPRPSSIRSLKRALAELQREQQLLTRARPVFPALYRLFLTTLAQRDGLDPLAVAEADPQANAKGDPAWRAAAVVRHRAIYLTVTTLDVPGSVAGALAGVSKQAVSKVLRSVEDSRDDPAIDLLLSEAAACAGESQFL